MVESSVSVRAKRMRLLGCSVVALTMGMGSAAWADCLPAPLTPTTPMVCSGTTVDQITMSTSGVIDVQAGAILQRPMSSTSTSP